MTAANLEPISPEQVSAHLQQRTLEACQVARKAAGIVAEGIATGVPSLLDGVRQSEKELDSLDREIDDGVTCIITKVSEQSARELLACMKFIIGLERIGDLLLNCSNRAAAVGTARARAYPERVLPERMHQARYWVYQESVHEESHGIGPTPIMCRTPLASVKATRRIPAFPHNGQHVPPQGGSKTLCG